MFRLINQSRFTASLVPTMDPDGGEAVLMIVKATYTLAPDGKVVLADRQLPLVTADEHHGEAGVSSLCYASDLVPEKRGTDVVLIGSAYTRGGEATEVDVTLEAGPLRKTVRVIGDRRW